MIAPPSSSDRAHDLAALLGRAEALADLVREHGHPCRVVVGRKHGTIRIKAARRPVPRMWAAAAPRWARPVLLPVCRTVVLDWLLSDTSPQI